MRNINELPECPVATTIFNFGDKEEKNYKLMIPDAHSIKLHFYSEWEEFGGCEKKKQEDHTVDDDEFEVSLKPYSAKYYMVKKNEDVA